MKAAFAILFSFLLIAGPTASPAGPSVMAADCACTACSKGCCVNRQAPTPPVQPTAPATTQSQEQWQLLMTRVICLLNLPTAEKPTLSIPASRPPTAPAIPIYARNCSFLI